MGIPQRKNSKAVHIEVFKKVFAVSNYTPLRLVDHFEGESLLTEDVRRKPLLSRSNAACKLMNWILGVILCSRFSSCFG
jgi:hypothetical protein